MTLLFCIQNSAWQLWEISGDVVVLHAGYTPSQQFEMQFWASVSHLNWCKISIYYIYIYIFFLQGVTGVPGGRWPMKTPRGPWKRTCKAVVVHLGAFKSQLVATIVLYIYIYIFVYLFLFKDCFQLPNAPPLSPSELSLAILGNFRWRCCFARRIHSTSTIRKAILSKSVCVWESGFYCERCVSISRHGSMICHDLNWPMHNFSMDIGWLNRNPVKIVGELHLSYSIILFLALKMFFFSPGVCVQPFKNTEGSSVATSVTKILLFQTNDSTIFGWWYLATNKFLV